VSLVGRRVINTRPAAQAESLSELLRSHGAVPVEIPMIEVVDVPDEVERLAALADRLDRFAWVVVTSPNGAVSLNQVLSTADCSGRRLPEVAAVGVATAQALHVPAALVPSKQNGDGLVAEFADGSGPVLVIQSADAAPTVVDGLRARGWDVTAVATHRAQPVTVTDQHRARAAGTDVLLLASGSAARAWAASLIDVTPPLVISIGPQCTEVATAAGLQVTVTADRHSVDGLVAALDALDGWPADRSSG